VGVVAVGVGVGVVVVGVGGAWAGYLLPHWTGSSQEQAGEARAGFMPGQVKVVRSALLIKLQGLLYSR
jgi:hypothetical protein